MNQRLIRTETPIDLFPTLQPLRRGPGDPTTRLERNVAWRAARSPEGPFTLRMESTPTGVDVRAWGPGMEWALEKAPDLVGATDDPAPLEPKHSLVLDLQNRMPGLRFPAWPQVVDILVPTVLEQKVIAHTAKRAYARLVRHFGTHAPGPAGLWLPPEPSTLAELPYYDFHPYGVEKRRAVVIKEICSRAKRLEEAATLPHDRRRRRLEAIHGVGAWTSAEVARIAWADPDAVSVNDFHLPNTVCWALAREPRGTDERMLELLAPYEGQRARVVRLIEAAGIAAPRFGPRLAVQPIAAF